MHAREHGVAVGWLAVRSLEHAGARLRVPDQVVADHLHVAIEAELRVAIGGPGSGLDVGLRVVRDVR